MSLEKSLLVYCSSLCNCLPFFLFFSADAQAFLVAKKMLITHFNTSERGVTGF